MEQDTDINGISYTIPLDGVDKNVFGENTTTTAALSVNTERFDVISIEIQCLEGHLCRLVIHKDDLVWDLVEADEREMGTESHYEAVVQKECEECGSEVIVIFHVWEYPDGVYNDSEIEIENAKLISEVNREIIQKLFYQLRAETHYEAEQ